MGSLQSTYFKNDILPNWDSYLNRTSWDCSLKEELMLQIRIRWWVMGGRCAYGAMPRKAVQAMSIYKGFYHLCGSACVMEAMHVAAVFK
jgi:hypothetical protein